MGKIYKKGAATNQALFWVVFGVIVVGLILLASSSGTFKGYKGGVSYDYGDSFAFGEECPTIMADSDEECVEQLRKIKGWDGTWEWDGPPLDNECRYRCPTGFPGRTAPLGGQRVSGPVGLFSLDLPDEGCPDPTVVEPFNPCGEFDTFEECKANAGPPYSCDWDPRRLLKGDDACYD